MKETICRASITLRNGKTIYASDYGIKAFCWNSKEKESTKTENPPAREEDSEEAKTAS